MTKHISYQKFNNANSYTLNKIDTNIQCHVFEKVHGCNFGKHVFEDGSVKLASRNGWVLEDNTFYGINSIREDLVNKAKKIANILNTKNRVIIFGELFGGNYPGLDAKTFEKTKDNEYKNQIKKVQRGVFYCPHLEFFAFDLCEVINGRKKYYDYDIYSKIFEQVGLNYLKPVFSGTMEECLNFDVETFQSQIPHILEIEPIVENNIAEGIVIKPTKTTYFGNDRIIFKKKSSKFSDKSINKQKILKSNHIDENSLKIINEINCYINENTLNSIISKDIFKGEDFNNINRKKLSGFIIKDAIDTYKRDTGNDLPDKQRKLITSQLSTLSFIFLNEILTNK